MFEGERTSAALLAHTVPPPQEGKGILVYAILCSVLVFFTFDLASQHRKLFSELGQFLVFFEKRPADYGNQPKTKEVLLDDLRGFEDPG